MRRDLLVGLLPFASSVLGQTIEEISQDAMLADSEIEDGILLGSDGDFTALAATDEELESHGTRIDLEWSWGGRATADESGYLIIPPTGKGYRAFPEYRLQSVKFGPGGPCHLVYTNTSGTEPPLPEGVEPWEKNETMTFGPEGGETIFKGAGSLPGGTYSTAKLQYVYCGAEESFQGIDVPGGSCPDAAHGDLSTELLTLCCSGTPFWKADVWDANDMNDYMRKGLEHFNKNGWPSSIINTFATHNMETFQPTQNLKPNQPFWEWKCRSMHDDCNMDDLSEQTACVIDPKRATVLKAMENLAHMWVSSRTKFTEDALTEVVLTLPGISKSLFPVPDPKFNAPGDYADSTWVMIGGGIVGLLVAPLPLITSAAALAGPAGVAAGIIGGIMWQVGLALGPMNIAGAEKDPHFANFGTFSEQDARSWVKSIYSSYTAVFDQFFVSKPSKPVDIDHTLAIFSGGGLIPRDEAQRTINSFETIQDDLENTFLAPLVNLAWQRQQVFIIKMPKGGIEFWRHRDKDLLNPYGEDRTSVTYDPCRKGEGDIGWRRSFRTSERKEPTEWTKLGDQKRYACHEEERNGYAFMAWNGGWERAWDDYGFGEMNERGLKLDRIADKAWTNQNIFGFNGGVPDTWEQKLEDMSDTAGAFMNNPSALEFWNIPVCDLTAAHDTQMGLIPVEGCQQKFRGGFSGNNQYLDEWVCINQGIRNWCKANMKDKNGNGWPFDL